MKLVTTFCDVSGATVNTNTSGYKTSCNLLQKHITARHYTVSQRSGSAIAEGPRDELVSRNSATTKYRYRVALFA